MYNGTLRLNSSLCLILLGTIHTYTFDTRTIYSTSRQPRHLDVASNNLPMP
jgi:hypothetical protein